MKLSVACLVALLVTAPVTAATVKPKPYQWTTAQASAAIMRQSEDFYVDYFDEFGGQSLPRDLTAAQCRGTGKAVQRHFVAFKCTVSVQRGIAVPLLSVSVIAKTRKAGGLCWAVPPQPIPSGCLAPGKRGEGSVRDAFVAIARQVGTMNQNFRCWPNGAGFFSCHWSDAGGIHRGTVVFSPAPVVKIIS